MGESLSSRPFWLTAELAAAGYTEGKIRAAVRRGELHRLSRGVYTSSPPDDLTALQALSHLVPEMVYTGPTALFLYDERPMLWPARGLVPSTGRAGTRDRLLLRSRDRKDTERHRSCHGVAVTTPLQAAVDVRASRTPTSTDEELRRFLTRMYDGAKGNDVLAADLTVLTPGKAHAAALLDGLTTGTASKLEKQAVRLVRKAVAGLPVTVQVNGLIGQYRFDIVIPEARVLIEIDSFHYHAVTDLADTRGFIRDRWKANAAAQWGWLVLRYTDFCSVPAGWIPGSSPRCAISSSDGRTAGGRGFRTTVTRGCGRSIRN
ncbi:hypothetical protein ACT3SZ_04520 [Corynebacterium sp. AOP40-9SA-29]|uniref:hypothetical protein n=1 Tax=Corynebacterium sp. AOP40-9SA-29 TaxID=3457677 RepID=UPI004034A1F5